MWCAISVDILADAYGQCDSVCLCKCTLCFPEYLKCTSCDCHSFPSPVHRVFALQTYRTNAFAEFYHRFKEVNEKSSHNHGSRELCRSQGMIRLEFTASNHSKTVKNGPRFHSLESILVHSILHSRWDWLFDQFPMVCLTPSNVISTTASCLTRHS